MADGLLNKASIILTPTGYKAGTLYNVAPVVEPYEDFDFARASVASRVNSSGLVEMVGRTLGSELITNGDFATDSDWSKSGNVEISGGSANFDIISGAFTRIRQNITLTNSKTYKLTLKVIGDNSSKQIKVRDTASGDAGGLQEVITLVEGTTNYTFYFTANANSDAIYIKRHTSSGDYEFSIDNVSVKELIDTNNIPRINYDSNGDNGHILLEPTSTNLIPYSEDFSDSSWTKVGVTITSNNAVSPDGTTNASTVSFSAPSQYLLFNKFMTTVVGESVSISIYADTNTSDFLSFGGATPSGTDVSNIETLNNGFYRHTITRTFTVATTDTVQFIIYDASVGNYVIWGAQLEALSYATSYIPTLTGSTVTRATETATGAGSADLINSTEGVLYAEIAALETTSSGSNYITITDGTYNNRASILFSGGATNQIRFFLRVGGASQVDKNQSVTNVKSFNKVAFKYKANDFAVWINGVEVQTDTSGSVWTSGTINQLTFSEIGTATGAFRGKVKALAVFNEALSDSELTQLTT